MGGREPAPAAACAGRCSASAAAAAAVGAWMAYTAQVKASPTYAHPAYAYQRAGYQFYNVDYAENMSYVDPFRPELGRVTGRKAMNRVRRTWSACR